MSTQIYIDHADLIDAGFTVVDDEGVKTYTSPDGDVLDSLYEYDGFCCDCRFNGHNYHSIVPIVWKYQLNIRLS